MQTDEPDVLAWMACFAGRRPDTRISAPGHHWWREWITDEWRAADHAWWLQREAEALGYETEMREFEADNPRPKLGDFMVHLSVGPPPEDQAA